MNSNFETQSTNPVERLNQLMLNWNWNRRFNQKYKEFKGPDKQRKRYSR